jgi:hypothetical protein
MGEKRGVSRGIELKWIDGTSPFEGLGQVGRVQMIVREQIKRYDGLSVLWTKGKKTKSMEQSGGREAEDMETEQAMAKLHRRGAEVAGPRDSDSHIGAGPMW